MSMNTHIIATIEATLSNGKTHTLHDTFDLYQTPTKITYQILQAADPQQAYIDWARSRFDQGAELDTHLCKLAKWIDEHRADGWTITWLDL